MHLPRPLAFMATMMESHYISYHTILYYFILYLAAWLVARSERQVAANSVEITRQA